MKFTASITVMALALTGCASIISGGTQPVTIKSVPEGASVSVINRSGAKVHTGTTPVTLTLNRGAGYFTPENYKVIVTKDGFASKEVVISGTLNGWYIGNIVFGGLIGMLAVDPLTGAMYALPDNVTATLDAGKAAQSANTLTIVSTDSLSPEAMKNARLLAAQ